MTIQTGILWIDTANYALVDGVRAFAVDQIAGYAPTCGCRGMEHYVRPHGQVWKPMSLPEDKVASPRLGARAVPTCWYRAASLPTV